MKKKILFVLNIFCLYLYYFGIALLLCRVVVEHPEFSINQIALAFCFSFGSLECLTDFTGDKFYKKGENENAS